MNVVSWLLVILGYGKPPKYQNIEKESGPSPPKYDDAIKLKQIAVVKPIRMEPKGRGKGGHTFVKQETCSFGRGRMQYREKEEQNVKCIYEKKDFSYEF